MRELIQSNGCESTPAGRRVFSPSGRGLRWLGIAAAFLWMSLSPAFAQILRLGSFDLSVNASGDVTYDSNVDDVYPEEEDPNLPAGDFYWMPGLSIHSKTAGMSPHTSFDLGADFAYRDYLERNDLDTEIYNFRAGFQSFYPRLKLNGLVGTEFSTESEQDEYRPGGAVRDPMRTDTVNLSANLNIRKFRAETRWDLTRERHANEVDQEGDNDETILFWGVYLDLFSWGSLFYSWENTETTLILADETTDETVETFGLEGAIPLDILRHPKITYSFGFSYQDETTTTEDSENEKTWEPTHTITVSDEFQLSKTVQLSASATWENTAVDDEISFIYEAQLEQQLGASAQHSLTFSREPQSTFGSTAETDTTTYGYLYSINDLFFHHLSMNFGATYEESTTLGGVDSETEKTTTVDFGLNHTQQLSRRFSRVISYVYTWENSNFHDEGPNEKHLVTYGVTYAF